MIIFMLFACLCLLISASYAWLTMSLAPEVSGINTHIGTNGNLEIALLNEQTYIDPSQIKSLIGSSKEVSNPLISNITWGNLIDLSDKKYGLDKIMLQPSRLNVQSNINGINTVYNNLLSFPEFDSDGRFKKFSSETISTTYTDQGFIYDTTRQTYGVRCIGRTSSVSSQETALANSRAAIRSYRTSSVRSVESVLKSNGGELLALYIDVLMGNRDNYNDVDIALIQDTAKRLLGSISYIDLAIRQAIVGYCSISIDDTDTFKQINKTVCNTMVPLTTVFMYLPDVIPDDMKQMVNEIEKEKNNLQEVISLCGDYNNNTYSENDILILLDKVLPYNEVYINSKKLEKNKINTSIDGDNKITLTDDAGAMAMIADYCGNYDIFFTYSKNSSFELITLSKKSPGYLEKIAKSLDELRIDTESNSYTSEVKEIYGYAIDLAFRCNTNCNLLLQTEGSLRVEEDSADMMLQGNGSYMSFSSGQLNDSQIISLMDSFRVAFVNDQNNVLAIAKLNVSNYSKEGTEIKAPLYLYEYKVSVDGSISMGKRLKEDRKIMELTENTISIMTIVVWLDGDHVDNSLAANSENSLSGALNLQFASDANLRPADILIS